MKKLGLLAGAALLLGAQAVCAQTTLKVAIPQKGLWDTSFVDFGVKEGFFQKQGLDVQQVFTQGGAQTMQAVISGSVDIAMATGVLAIIGAYSKGAPVRFISAEMTGAPDIYWMVKGDSPYKSLKDIEGKDIGFSEVGSSSNLILLALLTQFGVKAHPVPVGSPPNSLTEVMSGQIPASWSAVPLNLAAVNAGTLRIIARGTDVKAFQHETIRANFANLAALQGKKDAMDKFNQVYLQCIDFAYTDPKAIDYLAEGAHVSHEVAAQTVHDFIGREYVQPYKVEGLDISLQQAHDYKFTAKLLTPDDVKPLLDYMIKPPATAAK
jgi:NitT/TauT family transport system substrate-binding protein